MKGKVAIGLFVAAGAILAADIFYGVQTANGSDTSWFTNSLGKVENADPIPGPLWLHVAAMGLAVHLWPA